MKPFAQLLVTVAWLWSGDDATIGSVLLAAEQFPEHLFLPCAGTDHGYSHLDTIRNNFRSSTKTISPPAPVFHLPVAPRIC